MWKANWIRPENSTCDKSLRWRYFQNPVGGFIWLENVGKPMETLLRGHHNIAKAHFDRSSLHITNEVRHVYVLLQVLSKSFNMQTPF